MPRAKKSQHIVQPHERLCPPPTVSASAKGAKGQITGYDGPSKTLSNARVGEDIGRDSMKNG